MRGQCLQCCRHCHAGTEVPAHGINRQGQTCQGMLTTAALSVDKVSGETHLRHHITADGYYRGRKVIVK